MYRKKRSDYFGLLVGIFSLTLSKFLTSSKFVRDERLTAALPSSEVADARPLSCTSEIGVVKNF